MSDTKKTTTIDIAARTALVTRSTKKAETDPVATACEWTFEGFSDEQIWEHAVRSLVIDTQRLWRAGKVDSKATITPADFETTRRKVDPKATAARVLSQMSAEEREAFLKEAGLI